MVICVYMYIWTLYMLLYIYKISIAIIKNSTQTYTPKLYKSKWNSEKYSSNP